MKSELTKVPGSTHLLTVHGHRQGAAAPFIGINVIIAHGSCVPFSHSVNLP